MIDDLQKQWKRAEDEKVELQKIIARLHDGAEIAKLQDCQDQIALLLATNEVLKSEVEDYKRRFEMVVHRSTETRAYQFPVQVCVEENPPKSKHRPPLPSPLTAEQPRRTRESIHERSGREARRSRSVTVTREKGISRLQDTVNFAEEEPIEVSSK